MIFRIWHGWTAPENADVYENLLKEEIFPAIAAKNVSGGMLSKAQNYLLNVGLSQ